MAMAMAMAGKQGGENSGAKWDIRAVVVALGGLCMPHGRFIWAYGHYTTPNCLYGRLLACLISRVIDRMHDVSGRAYAYLQTQTQEHYKIQKRPGNIGIGPGFGLSAPLQFG